MHVYMIVSVLYLFYVSWHLCNMERFKYKMLCAQSIPTFVGINMSKPILKQLNTINQIDNKISALDCRVNFVEHLYFDHVTMEMAGVTQLEVKSQKPS